MKELKENLSDLGSGCSLPISLEVIGERWCFMILRASFNGIRHFEDFLSEIGIARNILANRLTRLVEAGILSRRPCDSALAGLWHPLHATSSPGCTCSQF